MDKYSKIYWGEVVPEPLSLGVMKMLNEPEDLHPASLSPFPGKDKTEKKSEHLRAGGRVGWFPV